MRVLRHLIWLSVGLGVLVVAAGAGATPLRPAATGVPFAMVSDTAVKQAPVCPNGLVCYTPALLQQAYDFPNGHNAPTGAGQTIILVEAFGSPTIAQDLAQFDAENGLPAPPSFTVVNQKLHVSDESSFDPFTWAVETSLDVEYAHATAPGANIVLAVADTDAAENLAQVELEVLPHYPGAIVSQSFGGDEAGDFGGGPALDTFQSIFLRHLLRGGTLVASSGDLGASDFTIFGNPSPMASFPASSPYVLAVGGTMGLGGPTGLLQNGRYGGEQVWNEITPFAPFGAGASGGAPSVVYHAPPWQLGVTGQTMRAEPDVAYNAAFNGGVVVVLTTPKGTHGVVGGTSAAAPQWAGIVALANELRGRQGKPGLGLATPQIYTLARDRNTYRQDFHDILVGDNTFLGSGSGLPGYSAGPGYDLPTGLGTPDVARLLNDLAGRDALRLRLEDLFETHGGRGHHGSLHPGG
jgi:subtilase family serine protease